MCSRELMELVYGADGAAIAPCGHDHSATATAEPETATTGIGRRRMMGLAGALGATVAGLGAISATPAFAETDGPAKRSQPDSVADALRRSRGQLSDLTYRFDVDFPVLKPYVLTPEIEHYATMDNHGFNANKVSIDEHTGTHMDGPAHLGAVGVYTDQITVDKLVTTLAVIDISARAATNADTTLQVDDIREYERRYGKIPDGSFVAINTGWGQRIFTRGDLYTNRDSAGNPHFPGLGGEAVQWLIDNRGIFGAGTDTPSLDAGVNLSNPLAHRYLLGQMRYGVENIANISTAPEAGGVVSVGVMKHAWGYGGPIRMIAIH
jgi:kynurenine formamidase